MFILFIFEKKFEKGLFGSYFQVFWGGGETKEKREKMFRILKMMMPVVTELKDKNRVSET